MKMLKLTTFVILGIFWFNLGSAEQTIQRYQFSKWSKEIGYSEAVAVNSTLYFSGIIGEGESMEQALTMALNRLEWLLDYFHLGPQHVLKEKIYTNRKDELRESTALRKKFYQQHAPAAIWIESEHHREKAWLEMEIVVHIPTEHVLPEQ